MLKPLTEREKKNIARNIIAACRDIEKLNGTGYRFIMNCSGFIAHYDINGFKDAYSEPGSLQRAIERNAKPNQWANFRPGEQNADYYHSKRDTYNMILGAFCAHQFMRDHFTIVHIAG